MSMMTSSSSTLISPTLCPQETCHPLRANTHQHIHPIRLWAWEFCFLTNFNLDCAIRCRKQAVLERETRLHPLSSLSFGQSMTPLAISSSIPTNGAKSVRNFSWAGAWGSDSADCAVALFFLFLHHSQLPHVVHVRADTRAF